MDTEVESTGITLALEAKWHENDACSPTPDRGFTPRDPWKSQDLERRALAVQCPIPGLSG